METTDPKMTAVLRGKFFDANVIDSSGKAELYPTAKTRNQTVFSEYEAKCIKDEIELMFERTNMLKQFAGLPEYESTLDSMINEFEHVNGLEEECKLLRDAHSKLQNKLLMINPIAKWHFENA